MGPTEFTYQTIEKTYIQRPLVMGQVRQLVNLLKGMTIPSDVKPFQLVELLGDELYPVIAVVITAPGKRLHEKDIDALAAELEFALTPEQVLTIIDDFFACNPIVSLLEKLSGMMIKLRTMMQDGSTNASSPSLPETSSGGMESSGVTH